jgi:hypothetical protein
MTRLAFTARCARRRPASLMSAVTQSADRRREPAGDGPLDFGCAGVRRQPRPEADRARRRRFATAGRIPRLPNRLGLPPGRPQAAGASSAPALEGGVATRTVHGPRRQAREGVVQAISIRLKRLPVHISEFPNGITSRCHMLVMPKLKNPVSSIGQVFNTAISGRSMKRR